MYTEKSNEEMILDLLKDNRPHYSAEFRDRLGLLEYRKPITRLRRKGFNIVSVKLRGIPNGYIRPAYQLKPGGE